MLKRLLLALLMITAIAAHIAHVRHQYYRGVHDGKEMLAVELFCKSGDTAICRDKTTSQSNTRTGTCSGHLGVAFWCPP